MRSASNSSWLQVCRAVTAIVLTASFLGLLIAVTAFGIFTDNRDLLESVIKIVAYGIVFSCAWAGGASVLRKRVRKSKILNDGVKDIGCGSVSESIESHKEGARGVL
jgi:O-antigen/teichoic acid export membrane protein